ncbi:alpha carbonic anhydrase 7-like protein [Tanacetum coccineum]
MDSSRWSSCVFSQIAPEEVRLPSRAVLERMIQTSCSFCKQFTAETPRGRGKWQSRKLRRLHWHSPSEHTINGRRYDMELHMVHLNIDNKIAVISVLYNHGKPDYFLFKDAYGQVTTYSGSNVCGSVGVPSGVGSVNGVAHAATEGQEVVVTYYSFKAIHKDVTISFRPPSLKGIQLILHAATCMYSLTI